MSENNNTTDSNSSGTGPPEEPFAEKVRLGGEALIAKIRQLLHEGNVQRIVVKDSNGNTVLEIPVNAGVVAAIVAPVLIAVAALAALASDWDIEVYRSGKPNGASAAGTEGSPGTGQK